MPEVKHSVIYIFQTSISEGPLNDSHFQHVPTISTRERLSIRAMALVKTSPLSGLSDTLEPQQQGQQTDAANRLHASRHKSLFLETYPAKGFLSGIRKGAMGIRVKHQH